jgi:hypothetical protein
MSTLARVASPAPSEEVDHRPQSQSLFRKPTIADFSSRTFWLGSYDYKVRPTFPISLPVLLTRFCNPQAMLSWRTRKLPFFSPNTRLPVLLAFILGLQHALAMVRLSFAV